MQLVFVDPLLLEEHRAATVELDGDGIPAHSGEVTISSADAPTTSIARLEEPAGARQCGCVDADHGDAFELVDRGCRSVIAASERSALARGVYERRFTNGMVLVTRPGDPIVSSHPRVDPLGLARGRRPIGIPARPVASILIRVAWVGEFPILRPDPVEKSGENSREDGEAITMRVLTAAH